MNDSQWASAKLEEVCSLITDGSHFSPVTTSTGVPYVTVRDISNGKIDLTSSARISLASFGELERNGCRPMQHDVLFSKDGTVGKVALVQSNEPFVVLSSLAILRPMADLMIPAFFALCLQSSEFQLAATGQKTGLAIKRVVLKHLKKMSIPLPPLPAQRRIVDLMAHLDNQIANLRLERDAARAVRAATLGSLLDATREIPADYDAAFDLAFPAPQASPTSEQTMNDDWIETTLGEVASVNPTEPQLPSEAPFITMADVDEWRTWARSSTSKGSRGGIRARGGDTLFARITPCLENGKIAMVPARFGAVGGSTEFIVLRARAGVLPEFLFLWAASAATHSAAVGLMVGTTGRQRVSGRDLIPLPISLPPLPVQRRIVDLMAHLDNQIAGIDVEFSTLESLRRQLLASLLSQGVELPASYDLLLEGVA